MSSSYEELLQQITNKALSNLEIALMAIAYWMIESPSMKDSHLEDILTRVGYSFNIETHVFSDGTNTLTIFDMLNQTVNSIYPLSNLGASDLRLIINKAYRKSYITAEQQTTLINNLSTATATEA